jgi:cytochrome P450 PksS
MTATRLDLASPAFRAGAHAFYARMRDEQPVLPIDIPSVGPAWLVTRYDDVEQGLKDDRLGKDPLAVGRGNDLFTRVIRSTPIGAFDRNMLDLDPPDHTRLRKLVHLAFTPRRVADLASRVERLADELLARVATHGGLELVGDYALPIPMTVICELMGVPPADHPRIHRWSASMVSASPGPKALLLIPSLLGFVGYLRGLVEEKRRNPDERLISALVRAEEDGEKLTSDEVLGMLLLLLIAGHETTVNLIANGTLALLEHPDQLERLRAEPDLIGSAVEELLRFYTPVELATERYAKEPLELRGVPIPRGGLVYLALGAANRDPRRFPVPDRLDLGRADNRHLSFGYGRHFCVGAPLARLEGAIALKRLIALPNLRRADTEPVVWKQSLNLRGLRELRVTA